MAELNPANPPQKALSGQDTESFGYATLQSRLPVIVSKIVDDVYRSYNVLSASNDPNKEAKEAEAKKIIEAIGGLRYELQRDKPFRSLTDSASDVTAWNEALATYYPTSSWFKSSWLFAECYLYRRIREPFAASVYWKDYDPFFEQKSTVFKSSQKAVVAIATQICGNQTDNPSAETKKGRHGMDQWVEGGPDSPRTKEAFFELAQICLWGNATDLSLLDSPDQDKVEELQARMMMSGNSNNTNISHSAGRDGAETAVAAVVEDELEKHADKILTNDLDELWAKVESLKGGRVDIIMDNAGFELYVDMVFADYLIRAGFASKVVFHAKQIPWFVSDVMPLDFQWTLDQIRHSSGTNTSSFFQPENDQESKALVDLGTTWQSYLDRGIWEITSHPFWTSCFAFHHLPTAKGAEDLFADMKQSDLWIFKGDLNYRKLVYDCKWPTTTPFVEAIGDLSGQHQRVPSLVTFRTCKADVVVGLKEGVKERVEKVEPKWMVNGEYAVISFSPGSK